MFYDDYLEVYIKTQVTNELFQTINTYNIDYIVECDIQPSTQDLVKKTFGDNIESLFIIFSDEDLKVGDIVGWDNTKYEINKKVPWGEYNIYSVKNIEY